MADPNARVILCTGANRGIGFAIVQALASHPDTANSVLLLGCRDANKGEEAIDQLRHSLDAGGSGGIASQLRVVTLDVTSDASIRAAVEEIDAKHGRLDVLINNAGYAAIPSAEDSAEDWRDVYARVYDTNVTSVALTMRFFLPLLRKSSFPSSSSTEGRGGGGGGKIINVSSARGSVTLSATGVLPPTVSIPYSLSKTALNMLTVEMSRDPLNKDLEFHLVSPGHCKTAFNGFRGTRDPLEGANVVVELVRNTEKGRFKNAGFWETKGASRDLVEIPW